MATGWFAFRPSALSQIAIALSVLIAAAVYESPSIAPNAATAHAQGCPIISGLSTTTATKTASSMRANPSSAGADGVAELGRRRGWD